MGGGRWSRRGQQDIDQDEPVSYDLAVFDPSVAPRSAVDFTKWYGGQTEWEELHSYDDPAVSTTALRAWFVEMIQDFPPMNGPFAGVSDPGSARTSGDGHQRRRFSVTGLFRLLHDRDDAWASDYSVGYSIIYVGFAWSKAQAAYRACFRLAAKHRVGFIDVSSDAGDVWFPEGEGGTGLVRAFSMLPDE
jgi:hypothetical protein